MLSRVEKDFLMKQVESAVTASIKLYGMTGSEEGTYLLSDSFIKGQLKRERIGEKKIGEMAKGLRLLGCEVKVYGLTPAMIEYRFNINKIQLTAAQADLLVEQIKIRKQLKTQEVLLAESRGATAPMFLDLKNIPIIVRTNLISEIDEQSEKTKQTSGDAASHADQNQEQLTDTAEPISSEKALEKLIEDTKKRLEIDADLAFKEIEKSLKEYKKGFKMEERTNIGIVEKQFDIPTADPRDFATYILSIFPSEDDRTEIINGDTLETELIFTAHNYIMLPSGESIGYVRSKSHDGDRNHQLLSFSPMPESIRGDGTTFTPPALVVKDALVKNSSDRFDFEISVFKALVEFKKHPAPDLVRKAPSGKEKQPPPNEAWCVGCNPDNCSCCYVPPYTQPSEKGDM